MKVGQPILDKRQYKWLVLGLVRERGHVSFAEIVKYVPNSAGHLLMHLPGYPTLVLWTNLAVPLAEAIAELLNEKLIFVHPAGETTYLADGAFIDLPRAKSLKKYQDDHWYPVTLHHEPLPLEAEDPGNAKKSRSRPNSAKGRA
jgi:hypothetical protein